MPIEKKGQLHSDILSKQKQLWVQALTEKRKHIEAAKKYAAQQDTSWWDEFFSDQQGIIDNCVFGDNWSLETLSCLSAPDHSVSRVGTTEVLD